MKAVDLDRQFVPVRTDAQSVEWGAEFGRLYGGWLSWDELLSKRLVVLLAEAQSGKTAEFRMRAAALRETGRDGFFLRVEDLADDQLVNALNPQDEAEYLHWKDGEAPGWFFLDSVDEARLNSKTLERALRRFSRDVGAALERASVLISCRVSDWKGEQDLALVKDLLTTASRRHIPGEDIGSEDEKLLRPVLRERYLAKPEKKREEDDDIMIVTLADLDSKRCAVLARWAQVSDTDAFIREIYRQGLGTFIQRPGDLLELVGYWKVHGQFASFAEMTRFSLAQKLTERDLDRRDADILADDRARAGAERIAAALSLGKTLTLRAPSQDPDPSLVAAALEPADILPDWTPSERAALLRRGVFAPATYGRIRFHHRSSQEYLTANWLKRALDKGCPRSEIVRLLFGEPYGVRTTVPSMRAATAWLALVDCGVRDELLDRSPLELIHHGDPRSLPLGIKKRLLLRYADLHKAGKVHNDLIDSRSLWMFSDPALATTIRVAWLRHSDLSFRMDLLSLVREGTISECLDLAHEQAFDEDVDPFFRYVAVEAMAACHDSDGLSRFA